MADCTADQRLPLRIAAALREKITSGKLEPGEPVPAIETIRAWHGGCSRRTVGEGLRVLAREGLIYRQPALGYFVSIPAGQDPGGTSTPDRRIYMKIAAFVRDQIISGTLAPGTRAPAIDTLCGQYGCTRRTASEGLQVLADQGWIYFQPGMGYYVPVPDPVPADGQDPAPADRREPASGCRHPDPRLRTQVAASVRDLISSGKLAPGAKVPDIETLREQHGGCSRRTAGDGLRALAREGLVYFVPSLGYFVSGPDGGPGDGPGPAGGMPEQRMSMRIAATLRTVIASGRLAPDEPIPAMGTLAGGFGCSRQTAAAAVQTLAGEGLIYRVHGRGYFPAAGNVQEEKEKATHMSAGTPQAEPLLTPAQVAALFRVDPKTVTRWAKAGKLTSVRTLGGHRRYRESEVQALLAGTAAPGPAHAARSAPDPSSPDLTPEPGAPAAGPDSWMAEALRQGASIDAIAEAAGIPAAQARRRLRGAGALP